MSLRLKTILGIALIEALLLVLLISTVLNYMRDTSQDGLMKRADTTATLFATTTKDAVLSFDLASLETFVVELLKNPDVLYVRVLGPNQEAFAVGGQEDLLERPFQADASLDKVDDGIYDTFAEIREGGEIYGRIELGLGTDSIQKAISSAQRMSATIALVEMILVALFSYFLGSYLTGQLKTLRAAAKHVSTGDLDINLAVKGNDEISDVSHAFNKMVNSLKESQQLRDAYEEQLHELNRSLEERVIKRTAQLEKRNNELQAANDTIQSTQTQLLQSEKMASLGQLAAGVAHEINNPIGFVMSNLRSLQEYFEVYQQILSKYEQLQNCADDAVRIARLQEIRNFSEDNDLEFIQEDAKELLHDSTDGTKRIKDIVQGLKEFSHVDQIEQQEADLNECLETTLKIVNNEIKYACRIVKKFRPLPKIRCNPGQINQVFMNMLINASHATRDVEDGTVEIETGTSQGYVMVVISDNGSGIAEEHLQKLFDPFFTTKAVGEGTGLGLSISYGIIEEHHGQIRVQSEVGKGTRFYIRLPMQEELQSAANS